MLIHKFLIDLLDYFNFVKQEGRIKGLDIQVLII